ncbi:MAG: NAD-dependent epimerase/dehydratase family protein [Phycisphaerales bacterium]
MAETGVYVVTGGAGFVGANLVAALMKRDPGGHIIVVDSFATGDWRNIGLACRRWGVPAFSGRLIAEAVEELDWAAEFEEIDPTHVFHMAAITDTTETDQRKMVTVNAESFQWLLNTCVDRRVPLVYASSAATYGTPAQAGERTPFPLEAAGNPSNVYGFSKWLMEGLHRRAARLATDAGDPEPWVVGLRFFNVFGPGEQTKGKMASMVHQLTRQMLGGKSPRLFADGSQARDQVHVDDVVECCLAGAGLTERHEPTPGVYNVGSGRATSFNQMLEAIREGLGLGAGDLPTEYFEMPASIRAFYQDYTCADLSVTDWGLGWLPRRQPTAGIKDYAAYLKATPEALGVEAVPGSGGAAAGAGSAQSSTTPSSQRPGAGRDS